ncbi:hypothetical protein [Dysgonomonas alginatilytica]|uniref:hypothetical protein n=1 Tax=Dysgonomonas alginatilytica TaxID=1605892 RepID=UPI000D753E89|nr:hypothetical protein [Dysgonomonas alginatilytica]
MKIFNEVFSNYKKLSFSHPTKTPDRSATLIHSKVQMFFSEVKVKSSIIDEFSIKGRKQNPNMEGKYYFYIQVLYVLGKIAKLYTSNERL